METNRLMDRLSRPMRDLRISVTDQCNFRCSYCMPPELVGPGYPFLRESEKLSFDEIERLAALFVASGVSKIRLTGGEPLLRQGLPELAARLIRLPGLAELSLTTNGLLLGAYANELQAAGIKRINVSLDALDDERFAMIVGRKVKADDILHNIDKARAAGLSVKVNAVIRKGLNDDQVLPLARHFREQGIELRFIEYMDVGCSNGWDKSQVVSSKTIFETIQAEMPLEETGERGYGEVAEKYRYVGADAEVGFISSVSVPFCTDCTRLRLSSDGRMYLCLFTSQGFDLREPLRGGADDAELLQTIRGVWTNREDRYSELRAELLSEGKRTAKIEMSYIGG